MNQIDLDTLGPNYELPVVSIPRNDLDEIIGERIGIDPSHLILSGSALSLLRDIVNSIGPLRIGLAMPDYFEFLDICSNHAILIRPVGFGYPMVPSYVDALLISNPNNPTATYHDPRELVEWSNEAGKPLIIDEAYIEFIGEEKSCASLVENSPNLAVIRTFSKYYGMTDIRAAYCAAGKAIRQSLGKGHIDAIAQGLAIGKLGHPESLDVKSDVEARRDRLVSILEDAGCEVVPSCTNFVMARGRGFHLYDRLGSRQIDAVDLDRTPGIEGIGYCRIAVPSQSTLDEVSARLSRWKYEMAA